MGAARNLMAAVLTRLSLEKLRSAIVAIMDVYKARRRGFELIAGLRHARAGQNSRISEAASADSRRQLLPKYYIRKQSNKRSIKEKRKAADRV